MKSICSIFGTLLCKPMSVYHWPRLVQLGTHQHKERSLFWFSLSCLNFPSWSMWPPETKLIMNISTVGLGCFERNNNFILWTTYFSLLLYDRGCASFPWEMHLKLLMNINPKMCIALAPFPVKSEMWQRTSQHVYFCNFFAHWQDFEVVVC